VDSPHPEDPILIDAMALLLGDGEDIEEKTLRQQLRATEHPPVIPASEAHLEPNKTCVLFPYIASAINGRQVSDEWSIAFMEQTTLCDVCQESSQVPARGTLDGLVVAQHQTNWHPVAFFEAKVNGDFSRAATKFKAEAIYVVEHCGKHLLPILGVWLNFTGRQAHAELYCFNRRQNKMTMCSIGSLNLTKSKGFRRLIAVLNLWAQRLINRMQGKQRSRKDINSKLVCSPHVYLPVHRQFYELYHYAVSKHLNHHGFT